MAAIDDLRTALTNMIETENVELEQAKKNLRRGKLLAEKYLKTDAKHVKPGTDIIMILEDAQLYVHKAPTPANYLRFVALECMGKLSTSNI